MAEWLEQARAESATLSFTAGRERAAALRRSIDVRLRQRRIAQRSLQVTVTVAVALAAWAGLRAPARDELTRPAAPSTVKPAWTFADGSRALALDAAPALTIDRDDASETRLQLASGAAHFEVKPRAGRPFVVHAGQVEVRVIGTRFDVRRGTDGVEVAVEEGVVEVAASGETVRLRAGERRTFEAAPSQVSAPDAAPVPIPIPVPAPVSVPAPAPVSVPDPVSLSPRKPPTPDPAGALLATADLARREGRAAVAVDALTSLLRRHPRDPRAPSAAFTLGRVLLEEQNEPARAAAAFARVGELDPRSPLAEDALVRQVQAWSRAGSKVRARVLAERYLARYPGSARAAFVREHGGL